MLELFVDKIHFFKFLSVSDKPRLHQLKIITSTSTCSTSTFKLLWLSESFHLYGEIPSRKGKYSVLRTNTKPHQLIKHAKISYSVVSFVFRKFSCLTSRNGLNWGTSKLRHSKCLSMLVWYLLSGLRTWVYSCTGCGTSKIYLCLEDNRSSFYQVSLKSENKDARP